MTFKSFDRDV